MPLPRRSRLAAPIVITVAGLAACAPEAQPIPGNPPMPEVKAPIGNPPPVGTLQVPEVKAPIGNPPPIGKLPEPGATPIKPGIIANPPPPVTLPAATNPAKVEKHPDGTCWEPFAGNPPGQRPVRCP